MTRADARNHVAFGFGNHFCVGAALARQEMLSSFTMLLDRLETSSSPSRCRSPPTSPASSSGR